MSIADSRTPICNPGAERANPLYHLAKKARAAFEGATVTSLPSVSAQKFMTQVAVAMFNVHEIKTHLPGHERGPMEVLDDRLDFAVSEQGIIGRQFQAPIQKWMMIENARFWAGMFIRTAVPAGVRQLQTDYQTIVAAGGQNMLASQFIRRCARPLACAEPREADWGSLDLRGKPQPLLHPRSTCRHFGRTAAIAEPYSPKAPHPESRPSPPWAEPRCGCRF